MNDSPILAAQKMTVPALYDECPTCKRNSRVLVVTFTTEDMNAANLVYAACPTCGGNGWVLTHEGEDFAHLLGLETPKSQYCRVVGEIRGLSIVEML